MKEELEKCKQRFKQILGALPCAYIFGEVFVDGRGNSADYAVKDINHAFTEITGISRDRIIGKRISGLFSISSVPDDVETFCRVALTGDPVEKEFHSPFFGMHFRLFCFSPENGYFIALLSDLSQQRQFQERIEFLRDFANSTSDEFFILDPTGRFVLGNRAVSQKLGVDQSEVPGNHISQLNPLADREWWNTLWSSLVQKGSLQFETEQTGCDGDIYPVEISIDLMGNCKRRYAAVVAKNISSKRALSSALIKDQRFAEKAASVAGYLIWILDSQGIFRALVGGEGEFPPGPADDVFFPGVHHEDRELLSTLIRTEEEGSLEFRMKTSRGFIYHRAVWSRVENDCAVGICYPISGSGLSGFGSESSVMDTYCLMTEAVYRKVTRMKDSLENGRHDVAARIVRSLSSDFSTLTGQSAFPERVRFDAFLSGNTGMLKQLLEPSITVDVDCSCGASGLIDPTYLENILVRLLLVIQRTECAEKVSLRSRADLRKAGMLVTVQGQEGIQARLEKLFIPVNDSMPGLASVYAMVRSTGGTVEYATKDNTVEFGIWFTRARMSDESATVIIALPDSVDAARSYAALRDAGYSVAIENSIEEIERRFSEDGTGILVASTSMPDFTPEEVTARIPGLSLIQVGGQPPGGKVRYLPDGFRTSELVICVNEMTSKAEMLQAEGLQGGILWGEPHLTPPLF